MCLVVWSSIFVSCASTAKAKVSGLQTSEQAYELYASGAAEDVAPATIPLLLLVGGGVDRDDAMASFVKHAGFGDIVILRESGSDGYNSYLLGFGANSVTSIVIKSKEAADRPEILERIRHAEAIFFAGGDQANYARFIANTAIADAVNDAANRGVPIGGTSAGLAILGEFYFPAYKDTVTSGETLANPFHEALILERKLFSLSMLNGVITDSHFRDRDRLGRLVTFMARILNDGWATEVRGVGIDEEVALAIGADGEAIVFADRGSVYLLEATSNPVVCEKGRPLTFPNVLIRKLGRGSRFRFKQWSDLNDVSYMLTIRSGKISADGRPIY